MFSQKGFPRFSRQGWIKAYMASRSAPPAQYELIWPGPRSERFLQKGFPPILPSGLNKSLYGQQYGANASLEKWRMKNEEWRMKNEELRILHSSSDEEWRMKNEEWRMKNEELRGGQYERFWISGLVKTPKNYWFCSVLAHAGSPCEKPL